MFVVVVIFSKTSVTIWRSYSSHSEYVFESNTHCFFSMKYWRNWWHKYQTGGWHRSPGKITIGPIFEWSDKMIFTKFQIYKMWLKSWWHFRFFYFNGIFLTLSSHITSTRRVQNRKIFLTIFPVQISSSTHITCFCELSCLFYFVR